MIGSLVTVTLALARNAVAALADPSLELMAFWEADALADEACSISMLIRTEAGTIARATLLWVRVRVG